MSDYKIGMGDVKSTKPPVPPVQPPVDVANAEQPLVGGSPDIERANAFTDLPPPALLQPISSVTASGHELYETSAIGSPDEQAYARSQSFYQSLGHPEYAGLYSPFEVPAGYRVKSITKPAGQDQLSVAFEPISASVPDVSKSLTERLATVETKPLINLQTTTDLAQQIMGGQLGQKQKDVVHPFVGVASNLLAPAEALVYSVGRLVGFKTPSIPPTALSEAISGGIQLVTTGKAELSPEAQRLQQELGSKDFETYMAGTIFGDIGLSYGIGEVADAIGVTKLVSKVTSPIQKAVQGRAADWLTQSYDEAVRAGGTYLPELDQSVIWNPSRVESLVMKLTGATPRELPTAIIGLPTLTEGGETFAESTLLKGELGMTKSEISQLPSLWASEDLMDLTLAPRTAGYGLTVPEVAVDLGKKSVLTAELKADIDAALGLAGTKAQIAWQGKALGYSEEDLSQVLKQTSGIEDFGKTMYKGGRAFDVGDINTALGWTKRGADLYGKDISGSLFFEKGKSFRKFVESKAGSTSLPQLMNAPSAIFDTGDLSGEIFGVALPKISSVGGVSLSDALGLAGVIGSRLSTVPKQTTRGQLQVTQVSRLKKGQAFANVASAIFSGQESGQRGGLFSGVDLGQGVDQGQKLIPVPKLTNMFRVPPPKIPSLTIPPFNIPRKGGEDRGGSGSMLRGRGRGYKSSLWHYQFPSEKELARYVIGKPLGKIPKQKARKHRK